MPTDPKMDRGFPAIDLETMETLARDAGVEAMPALLASFIRDCTRRETEIAAAIEAGDMSALESQSHALTSSAQTFGALALAELTRAIEYDCRNGFAEDALSRAAVLPDMAHAARQEMEALSERFATSGADE